MKDHRMNPTGSLEVEYILSNYDSHTGKPKGKWKPYGEWVKTEQSKKKCSHVKT